MDILEKLGIRIEGEFADTLDGAVRDILHKFGLEEQLEKVSGDNEKLKESAGEYRQVARDIRGVVDDLEAERKQVLRTWDGEAAEAFKAKSLAFEEALSGEAADMDTIAELLDEAAEACATAERLMTELLVEIVEGLIAGAATSAVITLLTAGVGAIVGPLITAANVAHKALKAVKITEKLADRLTDLNRRLRLLRKTEKAGKEIKRFGSGKGEGYKKGAVRYFGKAKDRDGNPLPGGNADDLREAAAYQAVKRGVNKGMVGPALGVEKGGPIKEAYAEYAPSELPGASPSRPPAQERYPGTQSFEENMQTAENSSQQKIREDFG